MPPVLSGQSQLSILSRGSVDSLPLTPKGVARPPILPEAGNSARSSVTWLESTNRDLLRIVRNRGNELIHFKICRESNRDFMNSTRQDEQLSKVVSMNQHRGSVNIFTHRLQNSLHPKEFIAQRTVSGLHHSHHVNPRVPNYRLQACYDATSDVQKVKPLTFLGSLRSMRMSLWDEAHHKLVGFRALSSVARSAA